MTRSEEHAAFIQSLKALINRAIDTYENLTVGDVISSLEMEKFSMLHAYIEKLNDNPDSKF